MDVLEDPRALEADRERAPLASPVAPPSPFEIPPRYAVIALGSLLLLLASCAGVPAGGPFVETPGRGIFTTLFAAGGLACALVAALPSACWEAGLRFYRRVWRLALLGTLALVAATLITFAGGADFSLLVPPSQGYISDVISFSHLDAELILHGQNPYTNTRDFWLAARRFPLLQETPLHAGALRNYTDYPPPRLVTQLAHRDAANPALNRGEFDPRVLHSYPALAYLFYVPVLWAGADNILWANLVVYWALFAWLTWLAPTGWRHWAALVALTALTTVAGSLANDTEVICFAFILSAWHVRKHPLASAVLLGLGCAFKQYCWFFAPFFLLDALYERGWRAALRYAGIAFGAFLLPNLPFILASPHAWFVSQWLPMSNAIFPNGIGIIALPMGHALPFWPQHVYTALEAVVLGICLWAAWRWHDQLAWGAMLLLPLFPLFFAERSLSTYFAFAPWLALYAAHALYRAQRGALPLAEQMQGSAFAVARALWRRVWGAS